MCSASLGNYLPALPDLPLQVRIPTFLLEGAQILESVAGGGEIVWMHSAATRSDLLGGIKT